VKRCLSLLGETSVSWGASKRQASSQATVLTFDTTSIATGRRPASNIPNPRSCSYPLHASVPSPAILKGLCPKAQGCSSSRNPGNTSNGIINPNGVAASASSWGYRDACQFTEDKATTPLGLTDFGGGISRVVADSNPGLWAETPLGFAEIPLLRFREFNPTRTVRPNPVGVFEATREVHLGKVIFR